MFIILSDGGPIDKISYDFSYDYLKFIVRLSYDSDLKHAMISFLEYHKLIYEHYLWRSYNFASKSYLRKALRSS